MLRLLAVRRRAYGHAPYAHGDCSIDAPDTAALICVPDGRGAIEGHWLRPLVGIRSNPSAHVHMDQSAGLRGRSLARLAVRSAPLKVGPNCNLHDGARMGIRHGDHRSRGVTDTARIIGRDAAKPPDTNALDTP